MKSVCCSAILALALAAPAMARAQVNRSWYMGPPPDTDTRDPFQYRDVDNAQLLQIVAYALTPAGMVMEWGITRPLHYVATQTPLSPILTGDKGYFFFGQNNNADLVPAGTFGGTPMNLSNAFEPAGPEPISHIEDGVVRTRPQSGQPTMR